MSKQAHWSGENNTGSLQRVVNYILYCVSSPTGQRAKQNCGKHRVVLFIVLQHHPRAFSLAHARGSNQVRVCHGTKDKTLEKQSPSDALLAEDPSPWLSRGFLGRLVKVSRPFREQGCLAPARILPASFFIVEKRQGCIDSLTSRPSTREGPDVV